MNKADIKEFAFSMPITAPSYPRGPYRFINREFFTVTYETDMDKLKQVVPEPLEVIDPLVKFEFIRMPDSTGFGNYIESGQVIPVIYKGKKGLYSHAMYLNDESPIAAGREIWGFPKKMASPTLRVVQETLIGQLHYENCQVALATMGYKYKELDILEVQKSLLAPNYLLKIIPDVDGSPRICELVEYYLEDVTVKGAWSGPAALHLIPHAMAPVTDLPIRKVLSATHILTDLTLPYGKVIYDYLK
ncbi:MAG: acetoacetate decarboxylase [Alphaproteobacteria bacterium 41-28]|nr:MAG: acetoacetate decarboxylase [Alphaproteobacteria bacterium 41-28]